MITVEYDVAVAGDGLAERLSIRQATYNHSRRGRVLVDVATVRELTRLETLGQVAQIGTALVSLPDADVTGDVPVDVPGLPMMTRRQVARLAGQLLQYLA